MDENRTVEENKENELEKTENQNSNQKNDQKIEKQIPESEIKFRDKITGLWNRKYLEKIIEDKELVADTGDFTVIFVDIDNLNIINDKHGADFGDSIMKTLADGLPDNFGEMAVCCKTAATKMCAFLTADRTTLDMMVRNYYAFVSTVTETNPDIYINFGYVRHDSFPEKGPNELLCEAEYEVLLQMANRECEHNVPAVPRRIPGTGDEIQILMIDDSLVMLKTLQMMLKDTYKVLMTTSGIEGFDIAKTKNPDIILLDYNMPVIDGERIMYLLKKSAATQNIPVIFISGVSEKEKIVKVVDLKPAGYLLKPVEKDNLLEIINTVLQTEY